MHRHTLLAPFERVIYGGGVVTKSREKSLQKSARNGWWGGIQCAKPAQHYELLEEAIVAGNVVPIIKDMIASWRIDNYQYIAGIAARDDHIHIVAWAIRKSKERHLDEAIQEFLSTKNSITLTQIFRHGFIAGCKSGYSDGYSDGYEDGRNENAYNDKIGVNLKYVLDDAARFGKLKVVALVNSLDKDILYLYPNKFLRTCAEHGRLNVMRFIVAKIRLKLDSSVPIIADMIKIAAEYEHTKIVRWCRKRMLA